MRELPHAPRHKLYDRQAHIAITRVDRSKGMTANVRRCRRAVASQARRGSHEPKASQPRSASYERRRVPRFTINDRRSRASIAAKRSRSERAAADAFVRRRFPCFRSITRPVGPMRKPKFMAPHAVLERKQRSAPSAILPFEPIVVRRTESSPEKRHPRSPRSQKGAIGSDLR